MRRYFPGLLTGLITFGVGAWLVGGSAGDRG